MSQHQRMKKRDKTDEKAGKHSCTHFKRNDSNVTTMKYTLKHHLVFFTASVSNWISPSYDKPGASKLGLTRYHGLSLN